MAVEVHGSLATWPPETELQCSFETELQGSLKTKLHGSLATWPLETELHGFLKLSYMAPELQGSSGTWPPETKLQGSFEIEL